ncbi:MAG: energy transducer TonB [Prevotella sp.]|nr:energy transducer TonB [Prevotella sp.]
MINWHNRSSVYDRQFAMDFYFKQSAELGYADAINIIKTGLVTPINSIPPLFNATNNNLSEANSSYYRGASLSAQNAGENQGQSVVKGSEYSIVTTPDIQPSFKGGEGELMGYLAANLKYPIISQENGEQGLVIVSAIVNVDGSLSGVKVEKSVSPSLDKEAKRLVSKMPVWNPGMVNNEPVRTKCLIPVSFRLTN